MPKRFRCVFFVGVSSRRSLASEGCRGEAPAARASEMRRDSLRYGSFFALGYSREAVTESIGRDARVREDFRVGLGNMDCLLAEVGKSVLEGDRANAEDKSNYLFL